MPLSLEPVLGTPGGVPSAPGDVPGSLRPPAVFVRAWEGFGEFGSHQDLEDVVEKETIFSSSGREGSSPPGPDPPGYREVEAPWLVSFVPSMWTGWRSNVLAVDTCDLA